jgi:hypothetical protein
LVVAAGLFVAWLGYLAYLAATTRKPIVLSRPQFLVADLIVVAEVDRLDGQPTVRQVVWPEGDKAPDVAGKPIPVKNLAEASGWDKPGEYVLALMSEKDGGYRIAPTPPSPGYHGNHGSRPRIYPLTPETRAQLLDIVGRLKSAANVDLGVQP